MKAETPRYRRRDDGVLEIVRSGDHGDEGVRGTEIAIAVVALVVGAIAAFTGVTVVAAALLAAGIALLLARVARDRLAAHRRGVSRQARPVRPGPEERAGLRVLPLDEHAANGARGPATAVRLPGTAASPQE